MKKKKVISVFFVNTVTGPGAGLGGETTLNAEKHKGLEMYTGIEPGFLTIYANGHEVGVPLANVKSLVWEADKK